MAEGSPARTCPAPLPKGALCGRPLETPRPVCDEHRHTDRARQCAAEVKQKGQPGPCAAWPLKGLPFCPVHDPEEIELRRLDRQAMERRLARVRDAIGRCGPLVRVRMLELLVVERHVSVAAVEDVMRKYHVIG